MSSATYDGGANRLCVKDRYADDHSGVLQCKRTGAAGWDVNSGNVFDKWDHDGANDTAACVVVGYAENTSVTMRVCVGEWAVAPKNRVILRDGSGGLWCGPTKTFLT